MLGIPEAWRLSFHHQITRLIEVNDQPVKRAIRWLPAMPKLVKFFRKAHRPQAGSESDDRLISRLIAAEDHGDTLSRDELVAMIFLLLFAGHETSINLIGNGVLALLDHPEQMALLRSRPELMDAAIEELLRYTNPVEYGTARFATEAVSLGGVTIPKGDLVMALIASANHDETAFAAADTLDVTRTDNRHLASASACTIASARRSVGLRPRWRSHRCSAVSRTCASRCHATRSAGGNRAGCAAS